jgi:hypothetical protein
MSSDPVIVPARRVPRKDGLVLPSMATCMPTTAHNQGSDGAPRGNSTREFRAGMSQKPVYKQGE